MELLEERIDLGLKNEWTHVLAIKENDRFYLILLYGEWEQVDSQVEISEETFEVIKEDFSREKRNGKFDKITRRKK